MSTLSTSLLKEKHHCPGCGKVWPTFTQVLQHRKNKPACLDAVLYSGIAEGGDVDTPNPIESPTLQAMDTENMEVDLNLSFPSPFQDTNTHHDGYIVEPHPNVPLNYGLGQSFMDIFDSDQHSSERDQHPFYPWASHSEWELATFLLKSNLSMAAIDTFLKLTMVKTLHLSFNTAKDLRNRAEILPSGPEWFCKEIVPKIPTSLPLSLYYRNPVECLQALLRNPLIKDHFHFQPFRLFEQAKSTMQVYTEWLSGESAWEMQNKIPDGATLLGTILSSDKTNVTSMTGGRVAHPVLLSCANISKEFRNKASNHAFMLIALLPIPSYINQKRQIASLLENRLFHECLDIVLEPLKVAATMGVMLSDPLGYQRKCYTPLASYIVDTPESALIAGVGGKTSSVTMATFTNFGDNFRHPPRLASVTLTKLQEIEDAILDGLATV
ncbi:hypothetical protein NP233_g6648 [Leucocoprinus birnbaumii]|uniref:C2H2-type domain-containing protein n=1 Tax=Leucocoprinus birnbaumii TaxID=56174 RepID=A0AAD5VTH0_9AGAR|nr:hypothetical protein NP233_g6648 [Leucocoprinus birnbaumii]